MPTPIPIIETRIGVIVLKSVRLASRKSRPKAVPTEISAKMIGTLAATSVRKTMMRTSSANANAMISVEPCWGGAWSASPVYSVSMPCFASAAVIASSSFTILLRDSWKPSFENCTSA